MYAGLVLVKSFKIKHPFPVEVRRRTCRLRQITPFQTYNVTSHPPSARTDKQTVSHSKCKGSILVPPRLVNVQQAPYTADQRNRVSNLETCGPESETLPLVHRGLSRKRGVEGWIASVRDRANYQEDPRRSTPKEE
ncbi:hypothetical protein AVEN_110712-1 [Araneus ventricosus]|uniref:Uncharacterized protein n=1 Tax=Araneus ventricosus TaxID=182803 RepID=A0A4Y2ATR7_ARAVE|nr:hypothetical protein AVEN_110712-1 [Araneus ventricosus]